MAAHVLRSQPSKRNSMFNAAIYAIVLCAGDTDAELLETLKANWEGQKSAVATAHFRCRSFLSVDLKSLSGKEVDAVFASVDLVARPDDLRKVVAAIWRYEAPPKPWALVEVSIDGSKVRERTLNDLGDMDNLVDQGITVVGTERGKQTSILRTSDSRWRIRKIDSFRYVPSPALGTRITKRESGRVYLTDPDEPREEWEVDEATGFAHSWRFYFQGSLNREVLQFGPISYPGDVLLPTAIAHLSFRDDRLLHAEIMVVEQADVNIDLPPDAFVAKAPKGTLIVDARNPQKSKASYAKSDIEDVIKAFPLTDESQPSTHVNSTMTTVVSLAIGALVVVLLVFFYRRPRLKGDSNA
ncbi:MAG: hypothetical protein ACREHD_08070 [Pirellulales bacterium]